MNKNKESNNEMNQFIKTESLPIKYIIEAWKNLPEYPTYEDTLFEIILYKGMRQKFTKRFKSLSPDIIKQINKNLHWLEQNEYISKTSENNLLVKKGFWN